jgi:hypothetical protein
MDLISNAFAKGPTLGVSVRFNCREIRAENYIIINSVSGNNKPHLLLLQLEQPTPYLSKFDVSKFSSHIFNLGRNEFARSTPACLQGNQNSVSWKPSCWRENTTMVKNKTHKKVYYHYSVLINELFISFNCVQLCDCASSGQYIALDWPRISDAIYSGEASLLDRKRDTSSSHFVFNITDILGLTIIFQLD